jgi:YVTN family beta-propeller protein
MSIRARVLRVGLGALLLAVAGCSADPPRDPHHVQPTPTPSTAPSSGAVSPPPAVTGLLPGMPPPLDPKDIYAADRPNALSRAVRHDPSLIYVPNWGSGTVSVINPRTYKVIRTVKVGRGPEHVVPSWDMRTLWVNNDEGNSLVPINPATTHFGPAVKVHDPYNLYFTPDGRFAVVMSELAKLLVFRDPHTMRIRKQEPSQCDGVNHADFSANGRYFIASCEFSGDLIKIDTLRQAVVAKIHLPRPNSMPQDVKISPDGSTWYIADMVNNGVWILDGDRFTTPTFLRTGDGAHGLYVSRDSKHLYITNRGEGSISLLSFRTGKLVSKWRIPGGGSPDMGGFSADGKVLWLSGRYHKEVYALNATNGKLIARIPVGVQPHGLCVWPQPGRYSLGHTGVMR